MPEQELRITIATQRNKMWQAQDGYGLSNTLVWAALKILILCIGFFMRYPDILSGVYNTLKTITETIY